MILHGDEWAEDRAELIRQSADPGPPSWALPRRFTQSMRQAPTLRQHANRLFMRIDPDTYLNNGPH